MIGVATKLPGAASRGDISSLFHRLRRDAGDKTPMSTNEQATLVENLQWQLRHLQGISPEVVEQAQQQLDDFVASGTELDRRSGIALRQLLSTVGDLNESECAVTLWETTDTGGVQRRGVFDAYRDRVELREASRSITERGNRPLRSPLGTERERVQAAARWEHLGQQISNERANLDGNAASVSQYGFTSHSDNSTLPEGLYQTHMFFGPNEYKHEGVAEFWANGTPTTLPPTLPLHTGQEHLSPTAIHLLTSTGGLDHGPYSQMKSPVVVDDPPKVLAVDGQLWVVDGHHRIAAARELGKSINVQVVDYQTALKEHWYHDAGAFDDPDD
jgi:hypothetical protein